MQNAAPVSALLVRALEGCSPRHDTRLSRVAVDLLGPVPVSDQLWVRASVERPGTKIELLEAEMLAPGPDGRRRPVAKALAWRFQEHDTDELFYSPTHPLRPLTDGTRRIPRRQLEPDVHPESGLALAQRHSQRRARRVLGPAGRRPRQGRNDDTDAAAVRRCGHRQRHGEPTRGHRVAVPQHRSGRACAPHPPGRVDRCASRNSLGPGRGRRLGRHALR